MAKCVVVDEVDTQWSNDGVVEVAIVRKSEGKVVSKDWFTVEEARVLIADIESAIELAEI